jgi:hypothetical protein
MDMYKYVSKTRICDANAWGKQTTKWTSQMVVAVELDDKHQPTLKLNSSAIKIESQTRDSWENDCAKAWSVIGAIIGGFLDALTLGLDNGFFTKLFDDLLSVSPPGLPNAASSFSGLGASANNAFMFPGGQVFFFKVCSCLLYSSLPSILWLYHCLILYYRTRVPIREEIWQSS